tara:strand:- start:6143 stop:11452 length:5310 start_codon:yes stop_codon:yes gene_type:complete
MPIKTYPVQPYVDDFGVKDPDFNLKTAEEKNFLRILFKPGVSVQVRELNQMQSILQNQIEKVGRGVFKEGPVPELAVEASLDRSISYVDVLINSSFTPSGGVSLNEGLIPNLNLVDSIRLDYASSGNFISAEVLHYQALAEENTYRFYIKYLSSAQDSQNPPENVQEFSDDDTIELGSALIVPELGDAGTLYAQGQDIGTVVTGGTGKAIHAHSEEGVFFVKGQFVYSETQDIYAKIPTIDYTLNAKVVFKVVERVVNYQSDKSLLDNAAGYPNETAPGADRYTIDLQLAIVSKDSSDNDFIFISGSEDIFGYSTSIGDTLFLLEIDDGALVQVARPEFSALNDILAERTREESGDYALDPFIIDITGFYNDTDDDSKCGRGVYTAEQMLDSDVVIPANDISEVAAGNLADAVVDANTGIDGKITFGKSRFVVGVEPSIAYVDGYRIAEPERIEVVGEKARSTNPGSENGYSTANLGSYVLSSTITLPTGGVPSFDVDTLYDIKDSTTTKAKCRVRSMEYDGTQYRLYIYDIQFELDGNEDPYSLDGVDTIENGTFIFTLDNNTTFSLYEQQYNRSIYKLPADFIKTVSSGMDDLEVTRRKVFTPASTLTNQVTITLSAEGDQWEELGTDSYIVIDGDGIIHPILTAVIDPSSSNLTLVLTTNGTTFADDGNGATATVSVIASYRSKGMTLKTKAVVTVTDEVAVPNTTGITTGTIIPLDNHDIIEITKITTFNDTATDIKDNFVVDNGQRDGCYKKGAIKYTGSTISGGAGAGGLKVTYTYFSHTGGDYFSVNSYNTIDYSDIPTHQDMRLSDCLDFRARVAFTNADGNTNADEGTHLDPNSAIDSKLKYYLSRIDKLVVTKDSEFKLIKGVPAIIPEEPSIPSTTMHLYTLHVPAYTFCHTMIETSFIDNRRYTMRDIGKINSRVNSLEYYTTLSLLEREATGKQIFETGSGNPYDRFKNGIIVDSFQGHDVGNIFDPKYNCSMDSDDPVLRPYFETRSVPFTQTGNSADNNNVSILDGLATLSYNQGPAWIDQQKAAVSISVNPYDVATWLGSVKLSPSSDEWMETRRAPNIINEVGGSLSDLRAEVERVNQMGTRWNSWQTTWTGKPVTTTTMERRNRAGIPWGRGPGRGWVRKVNTTITESRQARDGIKTNASISSVTNVKDDRVIDVSFVPFMRARKVYFSGKLFKPNTALKVFFDGKDITKYATGVPASGYKEWSSNASVRVYHNIKPTAIAGSIGHGTPGDNIITDNTGAVYGWFVIPNNSEHQFPCGERKVILSDGKTATDPAATTSADATYTAQGKVQTKQRTLITTRTVVRQDQRVTQSRLQTSTAVTRTQWYDPLAQSFIIGENPTGIFIHSIDLWFSHKSTKDIPIKMYLVEVENGMPTQRRVPLSDVIKQPGEVQTSDDAAPDKATTFTFDSPVYLQYGLEYAIVTESNSSHYRQWLSEVGKNDVFTDEYISKNPFLGVSFKSQNASTWTPDQMKDFKMVVRRADYQTSGSIVLDAVGIDTVDANGNGLEEGTYDGPLEFSQVQLNTDFIEHPETSVLFEISTTGEESDYHVIVPNENHYISTAPGTGAITENSNLKIRITLKTGNSKVSPVIDLDRISLIAVKNIIGPEDATTLSPVPEDSLMQVAGDSELLATHGNATAVYMTKEVVLNNPSDRLDSYLNINKPYPGSNVLVYARFKRSEDNIEDIPFTRIDPETPLLIDNYGDYSEIQYKKDFSAVNPVPPLFTAFQVKIVLTSNDHALVPTVKDFRAIATV